MENIIEITNICKSFGNIKAVKNISFNVKKGELFSFLGTNGAGKSTTISMLCGTLKSDSGSILIDGMTFGENSYKISDIIGVVFQNTVLDQRLSVKDNLAYRAAMYKIFGKNFEDKLNELAEMLDFKDLLNRTVGKLSGGQRRRIDIARALIHEPKILILDEPTTGLDPQTRKLLWNVLSRLRKEKNLTVFLTTHYMEEAAESDYIVILEKGEIAAEGTPLELKNKFTADYISIYGVDKSEILKLGCDFEEIPNGYKIAVKNTKEAVKLIVNYPKIFEDFEITKGKMDDVFLSVTGKNLYGGDKND